MPITGVTVNPFTDKVMNRTQDMMPKSFHGLAEGPDADNPFRVLQVYDFSSIMALAGQVITALMGGDALVYTYFGFMHPMFIRAIDYYNNSAGAEEGRTVAHGVMVGERRHVIARQLQKARGHGRGHGIVAARRQTGVKV